jgi:DNA repair exonuclease SbcCD ATPase subunit
MSAPNGEALVSAINRLLLRLDVRGVSANEIVACIKPLIADSEAAAVQIAMIREYGNLCATNESLAKERDQLRAEVERLDAEKPWLKEANATNADLRAEVERLKFYIATTIQPDEYAKVIKDLRAEVERLREWQAGVIKNARAHHAHLKDAIARAERAEASLHALRLVCGTTDADKFTSWVDRANDRAERAEAEIKDRAAMMRDVMRERDAAEAELAAERARLDSGTILLTVAGERVWHCGVDLRAAIDAGIKEGTK